MCRVDERKKKKGCLKGQANFFGPVNLCDLLHSILCTVYQNVKMMQIKITLFIRQSTLLLLSLLVAPFAPHQQPLGFLSLLALPTRQISPMARHFVYLMNDADDDADPLG